MCHRSCSLAYKVSIQSCTQNGRLRKFNRSREIEFNFLPLGLSLWNLAHLFSMLLATKRCLRFLIFSQGLSYGLSKSKKRGKIITKLWKIITKSLGKNRQLAKLLSGFVTGQITVAKVVVTVAAQSLAWGKWLAAALELSLSFRSCSCLSGCLWISLYFLIMMPNWDHWFVLGQWIGDQRTSGLGLFPQRCRRHPIEFALAFIESLAKLATTSPFFMFSQHWAFFTFSFSQSQVKLPVDRWVEADGALQFQERRCSVDLHRLKPASPLARRCRSDCLAWAPEASQACNGRSWKKRGHAREEREWRQERMSCNVKKPEGSNKLKRIAALLWLAGALEWTSTS